MAQATQDLTEGTALQQYLVLSKNTKGKACAALIQQVLNAPSVFVFGELLDTANVQQLAGTEDEKSLDLLKIFAYGTYADYKAREAQLLPLTPSQSKKLKQLTIVSLSSKSRLIPYSVLQQQLDIVALRDLEDLIIDAIYQGIIQGSLDQRKQALEIEVAMGRDIRPESIDQMCEVLKAWSGQSDGLLRAIKEKISEANFVHDQEKTRKEEFDKKVESAKKNIKSGLETEVLHHSDFDDYFEGEGRFGRKGLKSKGHRDHPSVPPHSRERRGH
eukprot:TRINITY_DN1296_c0_g1_i1.p1 TRINITY_DN1296_c0_g1~~TRINITY_DN1296_c0_g1_i1.p1  ORF type:complete len:273 (-),score=86.81 TRINITY_DN1296_c0_g1_i1:111-929(-)